MNNYMSRQEQFEALIKIQTELLNWASYQPNWHHKLHGGKGINESLQDIKKLISSAAMDLLVVNEESLDLYFDSFDNSLGLNNIN